MELMSRVRLRLSEENLGVSGCGPLMVGRGWVKGGGMGKYGMLCDVLRGEWWEGEGEVEGEGERGVKREREV